MKIDTESKINNLTLIQYLKSKDSPFIPNISDTYDQIKDVLNNRVQYVFPRYTLHNTGHSFRVMEYMSKLVDDISKLNELEVVLMVYAALLHDIGMAVSEEDITAIKNEELSFNAIKFSAMKKKMNGDESLALEEYVRKIHSSLSGRYIRNNLKDKLVIPNLTSLNFVEELAKICEAHTKDYDWIKCNLRTSEVRGDYYFNAQFVAAILRLADILDIDGNRTPYNLYKMIAPKGISDDEWKQHYVIYNNEKIVKDANTSQKKIVFQGKSNDPSIHRKILNYIDWVKKELIYTVELVRGMPTQYKMFYETNPEIIIDTEGYTFSNHKMTLNFNAVSTLLMGENIYGNKNKGLRELIQNSIDSCKVRQEIEDQNREFGQEAYVPIIKVKLNPKENKTIIEDNGTGMTKNIIDNHFLNIGVSYYNSDIFILQDLQYKPIGNFGIGFLACFMLSSEVTVITRYYEDKYKYTIELEQGSEWISINKEEDVRFNGTQIILNYNSFMEAFGNDINKVREFMERYFLTDGIKLELIEMETKNQISINNNLIDKSIINSVFDMNIMRIFGENLNNYFRLNLNDYLKDIEGYALIKIEKKNKFIRKFEDIDYRGTLYKYSDEEGLSKVEAMSSLNIDDYVSNNEMKYLLIPLVGEEIADDFERLLIYTDDFLDETIEKMYDNLSWISIIVPQNIINYLQTNSLEEGEYIFKKLGYDDLVNIGHTDGCPTMFYVKTIKLFEGRKNELYLPFEVDINHFFNYMVKPKKDGYELFMRGVLLEDYRYFIPFVTSIIDIKSIVVNIKSREFIPNVSRSNVSEETQKSINAMIGKAIHQACVNVLNLSEDEKRTLENFISTYYE